MYDVGVPKPYLENRKDQEFLQRFRSESVRNGGNNIPFAISIYESLAFSIFGSDGV
jgi:hypothetical protein